MALLAAVAVGCAAAPDPDPPSPVDRAGVIRAATHAALVGDEGVLREAADRAASWGEPGATTGLIDSIELLGAVSSASRDDRLARLERLADHAGDPVLRKLAAHQLERDDAWLAARLLRDGRYSRLAGVWNGVVQSAAAALAGNPVGVARPLLAGAEVAVSGTSARPIDRKRVALYRSWSRRGGDAASLGRADEDVAADVDAMVVETVERELLLAERLIEEGRLEIALAHLLAARAYRVDVAGIADLERRVEQGLADRARDLGTALDVEGPASRADVLAALVADAVPRTATSDALKAAIESARAEHRSRTARYVLTGRRFNDDPLARYAEVERARRRSLVDVVEAVLWIPATLIRAVHTTFGDPVDDRPVIDALAAYVHGTPDMDDDPVRQAALLELVDRYGDRGEPRHALAAATMAGFDDVVDELWSSIEESEDQALPAPEGTTVPLVALGRLADDLALHDLRVDPPRARLSGDRLFVDVEGETRPRELRLDAVQAERALAIAAEWDWRRRVLTAPTYRDLHAGTPVELRAGVGASGVSVLPRLLPERYRGRDRRHFE